MSKTYKDQRRWDSRNYWNKNIFGWGYRQPPAPKDINEPVSYNLYRYPCGNESAKHWYRYSWHKLRQETKRKIHHGDYDNIVSKPINVDWIIC